MIHIVYATKVNIGGWATFTRHLVRCLVAQGEQVQLWKIGNNTEDFFRPFVAGSVEPIAYRNATAEHLIALASKEPMIIAALGKHYVEPAELMLAAGAATVIHDTAESTNRMALHKPWVIRRALLKQSKGSVFIRHPYMRHPPLPFKQRTGAVATSRVDFDKNTTMILDANRLGAKIEIVGFENRLYTKFKVVPNYPEWVQSPGTHPRSGLGSYAMLTNARYMVDLTDIKNDGGGTQYTFLEAWDAGAVPIVGAWWLRPNDDMVDAYNCFAVATAEQLALLVKSRKAAEKTPGMAATSEKLLLKRHAPKVIVPQIMEWLNAR